MMVKNIHERHPHFISQHRGAITGVAVLCAFILAGGSLLLAVGGNKTTAGDAKALAQLIQRERIANVRATCESQNRRNVAAKRKVDEYIGGLPTAKQMAARDSEEIALIAIDAALPFRDCKQAVKAASPSTEPLVNTEPSP